MLGLALFVTVKYIYQLCQSIEAYLRRMTSLSTQLRDIAQPALVTPRQLDSKWQPSFLFEGKSAVEIDRELVLALAKNGFEEIVSIDSSFSEFQRLFKASYLERDRGMLTAEENGKLNNLLDKFIVCLSPYFLLRPTQKLFEWLITVHKVQHYNLSSLLECILPYYSTNLFVRMVQLLPLADKRSEWHWLKPVQKSNMPLSPLSLVQHALSVPSFLSFICQLFSNAISQEGAQRPSSHSASNFYISSVAQVIRKERSLRENLVQILLPSLTEALKSRVEDFASAGLILTSCLAANCLLSAELCAPIVRMVCRTAAALPRNAIGCLAMLADTQPNFNLTKKCLKVLSKSQNYLDAVFELDSTFKMDKLCICLLSLYIDESVQSGNEQMEFAVAILKSIEFGLDSIQQIFAHIADRYVGVMEREDSECGAATALVEFGRILARRYPSAVREAVERAEQGAGSGGPGPQENGINCNGFIRQYALSVYLAGNECRGLDSESSLFLSLSHADTETRLAAVLQISEQICSRGVETGGMEFIRESLKERIRDQEAQVVLAVLEIGVSLFQIFPPVHLVEILLDVCSLGLVRIQSKAWRSCVLSCLQLMCSEESLASAPHFLNRITLLLVDLMQLRVPTLKLNLQVHQLLSQFALIQHQPLLHGLAKFVSDMNLGKLDKDSPLESLVSYNVALLNFISGRLETSTSLECFVDFLFTSLKDNKHILTSMCILALLFNSMSKQQPFYCLASDFIKMFIKYDQFFDILSSDYGNMQNMTSELQAILTAPTLNPKSDFVSRCALCRLSVWTFSSIVSRIGNSGSTSNFFWREDLSDVDLEVQITLSLLFLLIELDLSNSSLRPAFKEVMLDILAAHLNDGTVFSTYVSNLLTLPPAATALHRNITPEIRVYSLYLFRSFLSSFQATKDSNEFIEKIALDTCIIPALILQLISPNKFLRRISFQCLQSVCANSQKEQPYQGLVSCLLERSTDILTSPEFARVVFSNIGSGRIQVGKRRSKRLSQGSLPYPFDPIFSLLSGNSTPNHILSLLLSILESVDSEHTYDTMCTMLDRSLQQDECYGDYHADITIKIFNLFTPTLASLLSEESRAVALISSFFYSKFTHLHSNLILKFTPDFFRHLPSHTQRVVVSLLFHILIDETNEYLDSTVVTTRETLSNFTLNSTHIGYILQQNLGIELKQSEATINCFPVRKKKKRGRNSTESKLVPEHISSVLSRVFEVLLECQLSTLESLIPLYFHILALLQEWAGTADQETLEYNNNLLLSLMTKALQSVSPSKLPLFESTFDVLQIIRTIQSSLDVHVQVQGYILLSEAARLMPDRIIHSIMPIFTFMGTNIARNDDGYSFQVIIHAIEALIPPLINVEGVNQPVLNLVRAVLQVFVDAYPHIPTHRRITLFVHLVTVIGPKQYLYLLVILLILSDQKDKTTKLRAFARSLLANFELEIQISTFVDMMRFLDCVAGTEEKGCENGAGDPDETGISEDLPPQSIQDLSVQMIEFQKNYISNKHFAKRVTAARSAGVEVDGYLVSMIERGLTHIERVVGDEVESAELKLLNSILTFLAKERLVEFIKQISDQFEPITVDKLLHLLHRRLNGWNESSELESLTQFIELSSFLLKWSSSEQNTEVGRKSAVQSLTLIVRVLGPSCADLLHKPVKRLLKILCNNHRDSVVLGEQLLLLSELVAILKIQFLPHLPQLIPYLIQKYRTSLIDVSDDSLAHGCLSVFSQLLQHISNFLSPYLPDLVSISVEEQSHRSDRVSGMLEGMRSCIGTQVSFRIILSNVQKVMTDFENNKNNIPHLSHLLSILGESLLHVNKSDLSASHSSLHELLLQTFDFRSVNGGEEEAVISRIEEACSSVYINFILKLSERAFKSLYLQLREWGTNEDSPKERLIPFYLLSCKLANKLKSIFSIYLIYFVENVVEVLNRTHLETETEDQLFHNETSSSCVLLTHVLNCLENCLKFDQEQILTREYFDLLKHPLISQLTNTLGGNDEFQNRVTTHFIPCLLQFAARAEQDGMWKELTVEVLIISKSSSPRVRFASLLALDALFKQLGSEFLQVLPDVVPYLAELLEDESVEVEQQCQVVISTIESILGDSIQQYF